MSQSGEEKKSAYGVVLGGLIFLVGGILAFSLYFTSSYMPALITGIGSVLIGLFMCGYAYRLITSVSKLAAVRQQEPPVVTSASGENKVSEQEDAPLEAQQIEMERQVARFKSEQVEADRRIAEANRLAREQAERLSQQHPPIQLPATPPEPLHTDALHCTRCNALYEEGDAFCKKCGLALTAPGTKTELATQMTTCPNCSASVPADSTFCPKCGSPVSLPGITDATVLVNPPPTRTTPESLAALDTQAETRAATISTRLCPSCHTRVQLGPEERFCGNCGHALA